MAEHSELISEISLVEKLPTQDRLKHAKKRRSQQLKRYSQHEKLIDKDRRKGRSSSRKNSGRRRKSKKARLSFIASIVFLEAAARNDIEEVRSLLERHVSADVTNEDGLTALHQCCIDDCEDMMKLLLEHGADVNARDSELWTPLHAAATCGHLHLCKILVDRGAELLAVNADGNMPYDICEDEKTLDYIETHMADRGVTQEVIDETRLSTEKHMLNDLKLTVEKGGQLEYKDRVGATPLHIAAANGYVQVTEFLLDNHINIDARDLDEWTPVHAAACWGQPVILEMLVQNGADLEARTKTGETPLEICEDPEFKQRIVEMQEEISNNRASKITELSKKKQHNTRSGNLLLTTGSGSGSLASIYSSNTSLTDRHTMSASIRRTSMREKSQMAWKAAREEAKYFIGAMPQESEQEDDSLPVSNIDDVRLSLSNGDVSSSSNQNSPTDDKHVTMVTVQSATKTTSSKKPLKPEIHHDKDDHVTTVKINNQSDSENQIVNTLGPSHKELGQSHNELGQSHNELGQIHNDSENKRHSTSSINSKRPMLETIFMSDGDVRTQDKSTEISSSEKVKGSSRSQTETGTETRGQPLADGVKVTNKQEQSSVIDKTPKSSAHQERKKSPLANHTKADTRPSIAITTNGNHNQLVDKAKENVTQQLTNHNNNKSASTVYNTYADPPLQKFVAQNSSEIVGWEEHDKKCCCVIM